MANRTPTLQCIDPSRVDEADVPAYSAGNGRPEFVEHFKECLFCQEEVAQYSAWQTRLDRELRRTKADYRAECPDTQLLGDYAFDLLNGPAKKQVKDHLKSCEYCTAEYRVFQSDLAESLVSTPISPAFKETVNGVLRRLTATLLAQPSTAPAFSLRSAGQTDHPREYSVEDVTVVVLMQPVKTKKNNLTLSGLVLSQESEVEGAQVRLLAAERVITSETIDDTGSFLFENITGAPVFSLEIQFSDKVVVVPDIQAG